MNATILNFKCAIFNFIEGRLLKSIFDIQFLYTIYFGWILVIFTLLIVVLLTTSRYSYWDIDPKTDFQTLLIPIPITIQIKTFDKCTQDKRLVFRNGYCLFCIVLNLCSVNSSVSTCVPRPAYGIQQRNGALIGFWVLATANWRALQNSSSPDLR